MRLSVWLPLAAGAVALWVGCSSKGGSAPDASSEQRDGGGKRDAAAARSPDAGSTNMAADGGSESTGLDAGKHTADAGTGSRDAGLPSSDAGRVSGAATPDAGGSGPTSYAYQPEFLLHIGGSYGDGLRDVAFTADGGLVITGGSFVVPGTQTHDLAPAGVTTHTYKNTTCATSGGGDDMDAVVIRLDETGAVQWLTFVGGPSYERAYAIEVAPDGDIVIAGRAGPCTYTTSGVVQESFGGDSMAGAYGMQDGFVTRLKPDGTMRWSSLVGGDDGAFIRDMALDSQGNVLIGSFGTDQVKFEQWPGGGATWAANAFGAGAFQTDKVGGGEDSLVLKLSSDGTALLWAARLGGSGKDGSQPSIRVDKDDNVVFLTHSKSADFNANAAAASIYGAYPVQADPATVNHGALVKLTSAGKHVFTRYLGGNGPVNGDTHNLWVDKQGQIYTGETFCADGAACFNTRGQSNDPPRTLSDVDPAPTGVQTDYAGGGILSGNLITGNYPGDGYIVKLSSDGQQVLGATFLGGRWGEGIEGISVTGSGHVVVSGGTLSDDMPAPASGTTGQFQGGLDGFVAVLSSDLSQLLHLQYIGSAKDNDAVVLVAEGDRVAVVGATGETATLHESSVGTVTRPAARLTGTGTIPVRQDLGALGAEDAWLFVFDETAGN